MNLEDVARRAGVSTATVSRVLNNIGVVRKVTRTKVLKAAGFTRVRRAAETPFNIVLEARP